MVANQWVMRKFWDDSRVIFVNSGCYDIDSAELGSIIDKEMERLEYQKQRWLELKKLREEHNEKSTD